MASGRNGVLFIMNDWDVNFSGAVALVKSLLRLRSPVHKQRKVGCITGKTWDELNKAEKDDMNELGLTFIEPVTKSQNFKERLRYFLQHYRSKVELQEYSSVILLMSDYRFHDGCQILDAFNAETEFMQISMQHDLTVEDNDGCNELVRVLDSIYSVGRSTYQKRNNYFRSFRRCEDILGKHKLYSPNHNAFFETRKMPHCEKRITELRQIMVPSLNLTNEEHVTLLKCIVCTAKCLSEKARHDVQVVIQRQENDINITNQMDLQECTNFKHRHCNFQFVKFDSESNLHGRASASDVIVASGEYDDRCSSGMEFLKQGKFVLMPEDSAAAADLKNVSPVQASMFLLPSLSSRQYKDVIEGPWFKMFNQTLSDRNLDSIAERFSACLLAETEPNCMIDDVSLLAKLFEAEEDTNIKMSTQQSSQSTVDLDALITSYIDGFHWMEFYKFAVVYLNGINKDVLDSCYRDCRQDDVMCMRRIIHQWSRKQSLPLHDAMKQLPVLINAFRGSSVEYETGSRIEEETQGSENNHEERIRHIQIRNISGQNIRSRNPLRRR